MTPPDQNSSPLAKIAGYVEILSRDPRSTVFVPLAETYRKMGLVDDALEVARNGVEALPRFSPGFTVLGRVLAQRGQLEEAEQAFSRALEIDDESLNALKGLARICALRSQAGRARELLERAVALAPEDAGAARMLASLPADSTPAGGPAAERPAASPPVPPGGEDQTGTQAETGGKERDPFATATLAEIYVKQGLPERAMAVYRDLLRADPENPRLRTRLEELQRESLDAASGNATTRAVPAAPEAKTGPVSEVTPPEADVAEPPAAPAGKEGRGEAVVARLNAWLDAIQRRRDHVR